MPGETKIFKNANGWYDVDNPGVFHATRALCRDARHARRGVTRPGAVVTTQSNATKGFTFTAVATSPSANVTLTSLQQRLYDRLTTQQGVTPADAFDVITSNGYNAAASYGHMRAAGANHAEATFVINIGIADLSVAYGLARAAGYNHTGALQKALREVQDAQDDDSDD